MFDPSNLLTVSSLVLCAGAAAWPCVEHVARFVASRRSGGVADGDVAMAFSAGTSNRSRLLGVTGNTIANPAARDVEPYDLTDNYVW